MYCLYLRKSRADLEAESRGEGETLARHENMLLDLARRQKLNIKKTYREIVSGESIAARPVMQQLLADVERGLWEGVLVVEVERLARGDTMDQGLVAQTFMYTSTKIITPMKTYDPNNDADVEFFEFGLFMSRREYKTINRRLQSGRVSSAKEGKYTGNKPPYGYLRDKLTGQKGYTLKPHPDQAAVVKMIYDLYTSGTGISLIVRRLNDLAIPSATGRDWTVSSIRGILSNPVYMGKIRWNFRPQIKKMQAGEIVRERPRAKEADWILSDGLHPAIVDSEAYHQAQKILADNPSVPAPKFRGVKNPLAGLIICGKCGRRMVRRPYGWRNYPESLMCPSTNCDNVSSRLEFVESKLIEELGKWFDSYELNIEPKESGQGAEAVEKALERLNRERKTLEGQMEEAYNLLEQKIYTPEVFLNRTNALNGKIEVIEKRWTDLEFELDKIKLREKARKEISPTIKKIMEAYSTLKPEGKNKLLKEVLEKVVYTKERSSRWKEPGSFALHLYPKLPK